MSEFSGNVVLITGASEGIGRALAEALAPQGPKLVLAARNAERLESLAESCWAAGAEVLVVPGDLTEEAQGRALVEATVARFGRLDTLVANAGRTMWARVDEIRDTGIFRGVMELNYFSVVWLTLAALPHLKASRGRIVPVASLAGLTGVPSRSAYCASKHAVIGLMRSAAAELGPLGIRVNTLNPGPVDNRMMRSIEEQASPGHADAVRAGFTARCPIGRYVTNDECATLALYLLSDASTGCTGNTFVVDGGLSAQ
jgi:NAD(P)-dependent dehydrogenase (short-subunit alcohol dehydrogenase family)